MTALAETSFGAEGIYERNDLQRHLRRNIGILSNDLMVIAEEYGDWIDSNRRIDLLCIDTEANLVVVEIKRTRDGGHMELQALRYAAMLSAMTFRQLVDAHEAYLAGIGDSPERGSGEGGQPHRPAARHSISVLVRPACARGNAHRLFANNKPTSAGGFSVSSGISGVGLGFVTRVTDSHVELEFKSPDADKNAKRFAYFKAHAIDIEAAFGESLDWDEASGQGVRHISSAVDGGWKSPREEWPTIHAGLVEKIIRLEAALQPYIASFRG